MNRTAIYMVGISVISAAAGAGGGYLYAQKVLGKEFDERLQRETEGLTNFYKKVIASTKEKYPTISDAAEELLPEEGGGEVPTKVDYNTISLGAQVIAEHEGMEEEVKTVVNNIFVDGEPLEEGAFDYESEAENRTDPDRPYTISWEEFAEATQDYEQISLIYYERDDVLADTLDNVVEDQLVTVGDAMKFGYGSRDPNMVYVRNDRLEVDYEITRSNDSYARAVHNIVEHSGSHRTRKFRDYMDD